MKAVSNSMSCKKCAEVFLIHLLQRDRAIRAAGLDHGDGDGAALGVDQLGERLAGQRVHRVASVETSVMTKIRGKMNTLRLSVL